MNFNSQICTTRSQSERLLALGLKKETADMCLHSYLNIAYAFEYVLMEGQIPDRFRLPAWSLHRLIEIAQLPQSWQCLSGDWYNEVIAHIQSMIHINQFNKEYLEEYGRTRFN